jgi:hypothetical protein
MANRQLNDLFIDCLSKGEKGALDPEVVDAILRKMTTSGGAGEETCYFVGRFLEKRGRNEMALRYLDRSATVPREGNKDAYRTSYQTLAMAQMRDRGAVPGKLSEKK